MRPYLWILMMTMAASAADEWQPLWDGEAPGAARPPAGTETVGEGNRTSEVERPEYQLYPAPEDKRNGQGVVVLPGGGYSIVAMDHEGHDVARWLNERGITAMVVKYRVSASRQLGYEWPVPFLDARRAIRTMRANAAQWGIEPSRVGVMGFSAGGHLASMCATRFGDSFEEEGEDAIDRIDPRPSFAVLIYPVISMGELTHQGSRGQLLGDDPAEELVERLSGDLAVSADTPPTFLLSTADDRVDCRNSLNFAVACKAHGVPVALHLFEKGGHGYGLRGQGNVAVWPELLADWLEKR